MRMFKGGISMAKKDKKVEKVIEEIKEEVPKALTFTEKTLSRRGKAVTIRTYEDGTVEEH